VTYRKPGNKSLTTSSAVANSASHVLLCRYEARASAAIERSHDELDHCALQPNYQPA